MSEAAHPSPMREDAVREEIVRLEERIAALTDSIERCRKISLTARLVLSAGAIWALLIALQALPYASFHMVGAIATLLGGIVLFGSNASTWRQMVAARARTESLRSELIDQIDLRTVDGSTGAR